DRLVPVSTPRADDAVRVEDLPIAPPERSVARPPRSAPAEGTLNAERAVLDEARSAFARGDNESALAALETHPARYPAGVLGEEREALAVRVLAALGRATEARERGRAFLRKYPNSLMSVVVSKAIEQLPESR